MSMCRSTFILCKFCDSVFIAVLLGVVCPSAWGQAQRQPEKRQIQFDVWLVAVEPEAIQALAGRREGRRDRPSREALPDLSRDDIVRVHILDSTTNPTAVLNSSGVDRFRSVDRLRLAAPIGVPATYLEGGRFPVARRDVATGSLDSSVARPRRVMGLDLELTAIPIQKESLRVRVRADFRWPDFSLGNVKAGFLEPALASRGIETHIDVADGQSFAISGLLSRDTLTEALENPRLAQKDRLSRVRDDLGKHAQAKFLVIVSPKLTRQ